MPKNKIMQRKLIIPIKKQIFTLSFSSFSLSKDMHTPTQNKGNKRNTLPKEQKRQIVSENKHGKINDIITDMTHIISAGIL